MLLQFGLVFLQGLQMSFLVWLAEQVLRQSSKRASPIQLELVLPIAFFAFLALRLLESELLRSLVPSQSKLLKLSFTTPLSLKLTQLPQLSVEPKPFHSLVAMASAIALSRAAIEQRRLRPPLLAAATTTAAIALGPSHTMPHSNLLMQQQRR